MFFMSSQILLLILCSLGASRTFGRSDITGKLGGSCGQPEEGYGNDIYSSSGKQRPSEAKDVVETDGLTSESGCHG